MNKYLLRIAEEEARAGDTSPALKGGCTNDALGELLPDYIAELLADEVEEEVEDHLLDCLHCREKHLKILSIGNALRRAKTAPGGEHGQAQDGRPSGRAKVLKMGAFRKSPT